MRDYRFFSAKELACKCGDCDGGEMDESFMQKLIGLRSIHNAAITITSGFRCEDYDRSIGGKGVHSSGKAVDIACRGNAAHQILSLALLKGFKGIGVKQHGESRFLHIDDTEGATRPWVWSYK